MNGFQLFRSICLYSFGLELGVQWGCEHEVWWREGVISTVSFRSSNRAALRTVQGAVRGNEDKGGKHDRR